MTGPRYRDPSAPVTERVADLLGRMTLAEKVGQVNQRLYGWDAYTRAPVGDPARHRLTPAFEQEVADGGGMGALYGLQRADAWSGVGLADGPGFADGARLADAVQRHVVETSRLGIPVLLVEEVPHGHQAVDGTVLPVNLAAGASWDPDLYEQAAAAAGAELRSRGGHMALVSALDLVRDPRWGRSEECFGEDPYLAARFTRALVRGMRTAGVAVVLKHFAGQGATVGGRNSAATELGSRELHEIHLPAALAGVREGAAGLMAAYNEFDGMVCVANRPLLTGLLRERWGFEGIVMADGCAVDRLDRITGDPVASGAMALTAGCDLGLWDAGFPRIGEAVARGLVPEAVLDTAVARVLRLKFGLGLFEEHPVDGGPTGGSGFRPAAVAPQPGAAERLSRRMAQAGVTVLDHDGGTLPLAVGTGRIAVLGPNADSIVRQIGDYTAPQRPGHGATVLQGIREAAGSEAEVVHAVGCPPPGGEADGAAARDEAVALAASARVAVLALGGSSARSADTVFDANGAAVVREGADGEMTCGEGVDLADLALPPLQSALWEAVAATGTPVVVVLVQGRPHALPEHPAAAVLSAWYPGPWGGAAVADVLFGAVEPTGRLPVSVPRSAAQLPVFYNGKDHRYRGYVDQPASARHAFGHGLSFTTVEYGAPRLSRDTVSASTPGLTCRVTVRNTGARPATEVVQLYVRRTRGGATWPRVRELRGFVRLEVPVGGSAEAVFAVDAETLASVGPDLEPVVEPGEFAIETGPSSDRTQGARLVVTGAAVGR